MAISVRDLKPILELLEEAVKPYAVFLFGSGASGELREDSDIDLAFLTDQTLSSYALFMLAQKAAQIIDRDVDLIDLSTAETVLRTQVITTGRLILNHDVSRVVQFQIRTLKEYALLNDERSVVIERVVARESLYDG